MLRIPCINRCAIVIHSMLHTLCLSAFVSSVRIGDNVLCKSVLITQITHTPKLGSSDAALYREARESRLPVRTRKTTRSCATSKHATRMHSDHWQVATSCPDLRSLYIHKTREPQYILFSISLRSKWHLWVGLGCLN